MPELGDLFEPGNYPRNLQVGERRGWSEGREKERRVRLWGGKKTQEIRGDIISML